MNSKIFSRSPLRCLSSSLPWWTRPQFSTNKLRVRRPCRDQSLLCFLIVLTAKMKRLQHPSHWIKPFPSLFSLMPYLTIRNHQLQILPLQKSDVASVYKHLGWETAQSNNCRKSHGNWTLAELNITDQWFWFSSCRLHWIFFSQPSCTVCPLMFTAGYMKTTTDRAERWWRKSAHFPNCGGKYTY